MSITDARRERRIARIHAELKEAQALRQWAANESVRLRTAPARGQQREGRAMSLIQLTAKIPAKWRIMRTERRCDWLCAELEYMRQLRDFAAREAERLQRELIATWREFEDARRDEP